MKSNKFFIALIILTMALLTACGKNGAREELNKNFPHTYPSGTN